MAATLRAVQLLGRQFVLGQTIGEAMKEAASAKKKVSNLRYSYDMLGEGARTDVDALKYLASYQNAINSIATTSTITGTCEQNDAIKTAQSALRPVSNTRCSTQNTNSSAPITMRVHQELKLPSNMMSDWMMPSVNTPNRVPNT